MDITDPPRPPLGLSGSSSNTKWDLWLKILLSGHFRNPWIIYITRLLSPPRDVLSCFHGPCWTFYSVNKWQMRMIAAGQNDHPVWGHRLNSSQALIRHQSFPKRILEKCMNFCKPQLSKYMYEWITAPFLLRMKKPANVRNHCVNPARKSMKATWSMSVVLSWEGKGSGTKCSGQRGFVRQTVQLAQTDIWSFWQMAQVNSLPHSQNMSKTIGTYIYPTPGKVSAACNSVISS